MAGPVYNKTQVKGYSDQMQRMGYSNVAEILEQFADTLPTCSTCGGDGKCQACGGSGDPTTPECNGCRPGCDINLGIHIRRNCYYCNEPHSGGVDKRVGTC